MNAAQHGPTLIHMILRAPIANAVILSLLFAAIAGAAVFFVT